MDQHDLAGLTAVVTGGGSGIGRATVELLLRHGASVGVLDLRPGKPEARLATFVADVTDPHAVQRGVDRFAAQFGGLDICINIAGVSATGTIEKTDDSVWRHVFDINVLGMVHAVQAVVNYLRRSPHAVIVNMGSVAGWIGIPDRVAYSATKGAVHALTLALAADLVVDGIRVAAVAPGTILTPFVTDILEHSEDADKEREVLAARHPIGRFGTAEEVAWAIYCLVHPRSSFLTGTILAVDGGIQHLRVPPRVAASGR
ncbi:MAG: SDR family oxidoreductase [Thermaerobacter sp.]|nr:SDR family oxidoreductase [Thermaerobacter sp.]